MLDCLRRTRNTTTQTHFDRAERMENLRNAFQMRHSSDVRGKHLLLVDDVLTTGAKAHVCATVLRAAGAPRVDVYTLGRAP